MARFLILILSAGVGIVGCLTRGTAWDPLAFRTDDRAKGHAVSGDPSRYLSEATIIVDAGHGGDQPGAWDRTLSAHPEKTIVLAIADGVADRLTELGAHVIRTRTGDYRVELEDRAALAEKHDATLLVSIHADAGPKPSISGATLYLARRPMTASKAAAQHIASALTASGIACRGVRLHPERLVVLNDHTKPSVLVECGFLTNPVDARKLNRPSYQTRIASAIADGVADYCFASVAGR